MNYLLKIKTYVKTILKLQSQFKVSQDKRTLEYTLCSDLKTCTASWKKDGISKKIYMVRKYIYSCGKDKIMPDNFLLNWI